MPDEQTPEDQPITEPEGEVAPTPPRPPPRVLTGWIVSGLMFFLAITYAVSGYFEKPEGDPSFTQLQQEFESQFSFAHGLPEQLEGQGGDGVRSVLEDALKDAGEHEEAARIAVVAAYEIGEEPDEGALGTLSASEDELSNDIASLYSSETVDASFVEEFTTEKSAEFAVRLAQTHALEMTGEDGGRDSFLDKSLLQNTAVIGIAVLAFGAGGLLCLVLFFTARSAGRLRPVGFGGIKKSDGDRLMLRFAYYMVGYAFIGIGVSELLGATTSINGVWTSVIVLLLVGAFVVAMFYVPLMEKVDGLKVIIGGKAQEFWKNVGIGLYGYLCTVPVLIVVLAVVSRLSDLMPPPSHPVSESMANATSIDWIAIALTTAILAPLIEELTFRGLLFPALVAQLKRPLWAILVCGLLFAAIHPQGPLMWPALMMTGGTAAYVRYYTGSLVSSITLHVANNSAILAVSLLVL